MKENELNKKAFDILEKWVLEGFDDDLGSSRSLKFMLDNLSDDLRKEAILLLMGDIYETK